MKKEASISKPELFPLGVSSPLKYPILHAGEQRMSQLPVCTQSVRCRHLFWVIPYDYSFSHSKYKANTQQIKKILVETRFANGDDFRKTGSCLTPYFVIPFKVYIVLVFATPISHKMGFPVIRCELYLFSPWRKSCDPQLPLKFILSATL